jgi:hypothetical protein
MERCLGSCRKNAWIKSKKNLSNLWQEEKEETLTNQLELD